jgi:hypothetical protein
MKARNLSVCLGVAVALGCSDSTGVAVEDLTGTWVAIQYVFTNPANQSESIDWIAAGASLTIAIDAAGDYTATIVEPGNAPEVISGTIAVEGDVVTISESGTGSPMPYVASRSGDTLTLDTSDEEYDFDGDSIEDPASLRIVLQRQ